jgi:hypothetical protein
MPEKEQKITLEATGEFPFTFYIEKAQASDENEEMIIEGVASTTNIDHDKERMSKEALKAMESAINKEGVPLRVEHQKEGEAVIGRVFKAWVDDRNQLHMKARLDKSHPVSSILHHSIKNGVKMGLSVGGLVKHAVKEFSESLGGMVKTFYDVALQEVSVTPRPSNYDSWLIAKSIAKDEKEAEEFSDNTSLRREFLFENSQLDYLQAFAKSVPDKAWRKVVSPNINKTNENNMENEDKKDEKDTEKAISRTEFSSLQKAFKDLIGVVSKGFENVAKGLDTTPKEQVNPDHKKAEDETQEKAKAMDGDAKDTTNPDKKKPEDESPTAKAFPEDLKDKKDEKETEKAAGDKDDDKKDGDDYDLEALNRSIKSIQNLTGRVAKMGEDEKDEKETKKGFPYKADDKDDDNDETEKGFPTKEEMEEGKDEEEKSIHPLDKFVVEMTKAMEAVVDRMEKSGHRVLGFEKAFAEDVLNSKKIQEEIAKNMKVPGFKKSVAMGVPYMVLKDGRRFAITAAPEKVEKSDGKAKNFKDLYKTEYSSVSNETGE